MRGKLKSLLKIIPPLNRFVEKVSYQKRFKTELKLIKGTHKNNSSRPSILHFSFNKAATQYVKSILRRCAVENGMVPVGIHDYAFNTDFPYLDLLSAEEMEKYRYLFKPTGYLYSVFGGMIEGIPNLEKYKVVFVTRDPRDLLVSNYYSIAHSHAEPKGEKREAFMLQRVRAGDSSIDEYVLFDCDRVYNSFQRYQTLLLNRYPNVYLTTYEDMVMDFEAWLNGLLKYCGLNVSRKLFQSLLYENERMRPKREDISKHIRKGKAGDYKEKLKKETIEHLDNKFSPIFEKYKYS